MAGQKVILHIPHSSEIIPSFDGYLVTEEELKKEMLKLTDRYTDDLFFSADDEPVVAGFSRIFCDPERFPDDENEIMAQFGMGVLYEKSDEGKVIRAVTPELREHIMTHYYWKHHEKLNNAVNSQLVQFGKALIVDCHSYPGIPLKRDLDQTPNRPDFNIGTDSFHTPEHLIAISADFFKKAGYSLGIDWPYKGSIVPMQHYQKNNAVQSIMLEINRVLYMNESTGEKTERYSEIKEVTSEYIKVLKRSLSV
jgi:N-formylglutamate amidohydrolase